MDAFPSFPLIRLYLSSSLMDCFVQGGKVNVLEWDSIGNCEEKKCVYIYIYIWTYVWQR
jgi:hypothetical protein